jgi:hypothetical protein
MATEKTVPIGVRVPAELADWLKKQAQTNKRSLSNQAVWALDQFRAQHQAQTNEKAFAHGQGVGR